MRVKFEGPEAECEVFGRTFEAGRSTDVSDLPAAFQAKLAHNPTFTITSRAKPIEDKPRGSSVDTEAGV
ncbi:MAG TPA: hypothetical protein VJ775_05900 [Sphingomicrobium sp.]|nr:hypothetical protein [Sphingomicrobium sp.]